MKCELHETAYSKSLTVDKEAGVIRGVKVLGGSSKNRRTYTESAMRGALGLYEGVMVNFDHPDRSAPNKDRSVSDRAGKLANVHVKEGAIYADFHYLTKHPLASQMCEAAERMPECIGFSHNAHGRVERRGGKDVVEQIESVRSVDIVADPATTKGLFESEEHIVTKTVQEIIDSVGVRTKGRKRLKALVEQEDVMIGDTPIADTPVEVEDGMGPQEQVEEAFVAMGVAVFRDKTMDKNAKIAKIREILTAEEKLMAAPKEDAPPAEDETPVEESAKYKKLEERLALLESEKQALELSEACREMLEEAKREVTPVRMKALIASESDDDRQDLIESWPEISKQGERPRRSPSIKESLAHDETRSPKDFAKSVSY